MRRPRLILVGGFLAAGKTSMLRAIAERLTRLGRVVGLITNDQAPGLVDTAILSQCDAQVREVSGSCFCCNFPGFMEAIRSLSAAGVEVIVAEPVGSCTDLSATIVQPIRDQYPELSLAPLTVLVDPVRMRESLELIPSLTHPDALYIIKKQMSEADQILLNKSDTLSANQREADLAVLRKNFAQTPIAAVSALTGDGVDAWLEGILNATTAGTRITDVDYDRYAHGEAVLGWLNATVTLRGNSRTNWLRFADELLVSLRNEFRARTAEIGHVKLTLRGDGIEIVGNIGSLAGEIRCGGMAASGEVVTLTLNARVQMSPETLNEIVERVLEQITTRIDAVATVVQKSCLMPGRPNPTYRYDRVIV